VRNSVLKYWDSLIISVLVDIAIFDPYIQVGKAHGMRNEKTLLSHLAWERASRFFLVSVREHCFQSFAREKPEH